LGVKGIVTRVVKPGQRFGRLVVVRALRRYGRYRYAYRQLCRCDCGPLVKVGKFELLNGDTRSCGCYQKSQLGTRSKNNSHGLTHGMSYTKTYSSWRAAKARTSNPNDKYWNNYGGANPPVAVCSRWRNSFEAFLEDLGERPEGSTLGRFGDVGNYEPGNCAWMTPKEQAANAKMAVAA
jgi:hypothetical protein